MKRLYFTLLNCVMMLSLWAVEIHIEDPKSWTNAELAPYLGDTVTFDSPMFLLYENSTKLSPYCQSTNTYVVLSGNYPRSTRDRTFSRDLKAKVLQSSGGTYYLAYVGGKFDGNTRETLKKGLDSLQIDKVGEHTLLICAANLEYYLKVNVGQGYGPKSSEEHEKQRTKVRQALALINADIYGFCEIEKGTAALQEICNDLNSAHSDRRFTVVNNGTVLSKEDTYTTCSYVYDANKVHPFSKLGESQTGVLNRKYMQYFRDNETDEGFIFSINHFKAKVGEGDTEAKRIAEANAVNALYNSYKTYCHEEDLLIMGDLNAYAGEKPITILLEADESKKSDDRTDLHQYFHPEGSYSYRYGGEVNYLDHAIVSPSLLPQVTGMQAFHVNSDEEDCTYDTKCNDGTMFRYSDHDPIVVGLRLMKGSASDLAIATIGENLRVKNGEGGYVRIFDMGGNLLYQHTLDSDNYTVFSKEEVPCMGHGCYVVHVYHNGLNHVTKFIRP